MPSYKLNYFDLRAKGELCRLIFACAGVDFVDNRIKMDDWPALKNQTPLGQLPYLEIDGNVKLVQSTSIARYLANEFNLAGADSLTKAQANAIIDSLVEINEPWIHDVGMAGTSFKPEANKVEEFKKFMEKTGETCFTHIEKMIKMYGKNGYSAGDSITWADLFLYEITTGVVELDPTFAARYPEITKCRASCEKNARLMDYIKHRPILPL